jgi:hypothetical protein
MNYIRACAMNPRLMETKNYLDIRWSLFCHIAQRTRWADSSPDKHWLSFINKIYQGITKYEPANWNSKLTTSKWPFRIAWTKACLPTYGQALIGLINCKPVRQ